MKRALQIITLLIFVFAIGTLKAQYAPPAGQPGTTAMFKDSSVFVNWCNFAKVSRGYQDISNPQMGLASAGDSSMATGKAQDNAVVSLGDGGSVICTFPFPINNGNGFDFAVFENGFENGINGYFLELAFVEVSSDGVNFFRFPSHSLTDTVIQTASFGNSDAAKINNLAGKYKGGYGTPFDLQELNNKPGFNINAVTHVKIIDVVGNIDRQYATRDSYGNKINDPWPTAFPQGGFDLDAVGVIHQNIIAGINEAGSEMNKMLIYPNPLHQNETLKISGAFMDASIEIFDFSGKRILISKENEIKTSGLEPGIYLLKVISGTGVLVQRIIIL